MQFSSSVRPQVGFQLAHVHLRLILDALFDFRVPRVNKVEKVLHARDYRLAGLFNCNEHVFPIRVAIFQEISEPFIPNCEFGNIVVVLVGFLDVFYVDGLHLIRVVEVDNPLCT